MSITSKTNENERLSSTRRSLSSGVPVSSRQAMVRETVRTYSSRLPAPSIYNGTGQSPAYKASKQSRPPTRDEGEPRLQREEQVQEIVELKKALAKTRQDLQKTRSRRQDRDNRSSSDEEPCRRDDMAGSLSGSLNALSNKPCLNRELVAKLRSMTETIKMLSTENVALRGENDNLVTLREEGMLASQDDDNNDVSDTKLKAVIQSYEKQINEMGEKVVHLQSEIEIKDKQQPLEKDKYKSLARRLKDERNQYKEMVEGKKQEHEELKVEIEKMTDIIGDLRDNCGKLQEELMQVRNDSPRRVQEKSCQTTPPMRRASVGEVSNRQKISPKRTRSNISTSSSTQSSPRQNQIVKSNELSKPKIRNTSVPNSPAKGARIAKPVQRTPSSPKCPNPTPPSPKPSPSHVKSSPLRIQGSPSRIPSLSKIPTPSKSRIPTKSSPRSQSTRHYKDNDEVLFISEDTMVQSDDSSTQSMDVNVTHSRTSYAEVKLIQQEKRESRESRESSQSMEVEPSQEPMMNDIEFLPPPIPEEIMNSDNEFPAPPEPADLAKLSMEAEELVEATEDQMITTPRTLRRADSLRQKMAARRIQRTWKHFYQELEEKKSDDPHYSTLPPMHRPFGMANDQTKPPTEQSQENVRLVDEEVARDEAISTLQAAILGHDARTANLTAARARGGIYTARPWVVSNSETDSENDESFESLQGIIRSHSFRLKTLEEEDVFRVGKVSSIRAKFSRRSPDGASDDYLAESDRNV